MAENDLWAVITKVFSEFSERAIRPLLTENRAMISTIEAIKKVRPELAQALDTALETARHNGDTKRSVDRTLEYVAKVLASLRDQSQRDQAVEELRLQIDRTIRPN